MMNGLFFALGALLVLAGVFPSIGLGLGLGLGAALARPLLFLLALGVFGGAFLMTERMKVERVRLFVLILLASLGDGAMWPSPNPNRAFSAPQGPEWPVPNPNGLAASPQGCWSIFKRDVVGTFHKMSRKYMPLYVTEFQFRYNNRENLDIFGKAIKGC